MPKKAAAKTNVVLVRTCSAGVHVGTLEKRVKDEVILSDARRVWRWRGANTLHELSQVGGEESYTRISAPVPTITLTNAIEVIPCSEIAAANLSRSRWPS